MALGRRDGDRQMAMWVPADEIVRGPGHPFYRALNALLRERGFDRHVEGLCEKFYSNLGRPGIPPGVYFRMLLIGYDEGIDSERGIDWRCQDSLTFREFLRRTVDRGAGGRVWQSSPDQGPARQTVVASARRICGTIVRA